MGHLCCCSYFVRVHMAGKKAALQGPDTGLTAIALSEPLGNYQALTQD